MPFGESFVDEHTSSWESPYKFNGKELDAETGLYYFGMRYYDPKTSIWYGIDPLAGKYPGVGGMVYCIGNPIRLIDPNGMDWYENGNGEYVWRDSKLSKEEAQKQSLKYKDRTFEEDGKYYSLFGAIVDNSKPDGILVQKIDEAFTNYADKLKDEKEARANFSQDVLYEKETDFAGIYPMTGNAIDRSGNIKDRKSLYANGKADIRLYVREKNTKGKLSSLITKFEPITGLTSSGAIGLKAGFHLHIGTGNNDIAIVSFYNKRDYEIFKTMFYSLFPQSKQ
jgi:RHS repeat-associated protein